MVYADCLNRITFECMYAIGSYITASKSKFN